MINTEKTLEFDMIKKKLSELAYTDKAKIEIEKLSPYLAETEVKRKLRETTEARTMIEKCGLPPATALKGISGFIETAEKGGCLTPEQLEEIAMALNAVRRLRDYLNRCKMFEISLAYYEENLESLDDIREELHAKIRNGRVDDYASKTLKSLREAIEKTDAKMHEKADLAIRANKAYVSDNFSTLRNGHICIPVKKEYKFKVSGSVMDKSATGSTLFIEPSSVAKLYDELQEMRIDEENEEIRILYTLTDLLADKAEIIRRNNQTIEKLDFIFAKAKLSLEYDGIEPEINTKRYIRFQNARHPLMDQKINVPLNFEIGNGRNGVIITGPNTGGKTVAIKTVALNCMMAQSGLHVPCEKAEICMNNEILCDIGDGQNLSENLSTFSAHIKNVMDILKRADQESLVIMDELGSGTDPAEGMGIAIAILEELRKSGALFLVTTHYPEVKDYARYTEGIINARMTFDKESLRPLYQLVIGEAGESCAFYIAEKLGMPKYMLRRAAQAAYEGGVQGKNTKEKREGCTGNRRKNISAVWESDRDDEGKEERLKKESHPKIQKQKAAAKQTNALKFQIGDSVMVLPDKKIGIVCQTANEKGVIRVQMPDKKIWINHKRVKLHVPADQLYPEDYDFSIIFDSVEKRKAEHDMSRKYVDYKIQLED
ncbi:MAG: DNA mismatch repair protein MutS [Faecalicatena sp.]|uniref:endonuclease MutS2 n=1 Tax=Faecalicatena sp. TaxID=2005360 RepID=UPI0025835540|nr:DNA mismatch repair protein MutS [Faecalicatena sp.]MCI6466400.1 DNA mismatch repair protein MutS [Faecalicatena sp.]MCI7180540.1 DNA mismatch repair protein MutS [Lachnospiraceae bacterium]MDY5619837.1 DNA mismatch repair protein MutS [Lachnospiraceae bacterium]